MGDPGGFALALPDNEMGCYLFVEAIETAGYRPGQGIAIALDRAASSFGREGIYEVARAGQGFLDRVEMLALYGRWIDAYPILSIEGGFREYDLQGFVDQTSVQGDRIQVMDDDSHGHQ